MNHQSLIEPSDDVIAIRHLVYEHEDFVTTAQALFSLVQRTEAEFPGQPRVLFLDIEGHRNAEGVFDNDMLELQREFVVGYLGRFLSRITTPLGELHNTVAQVNKLPEKLRIATEEELN